MILTHHQVNLNLQEKCVCFQPYTDASVWQETLRSLAVSGGQILGQGESFRHPYLQVQRRHGRQQGPLRVASQTAYGWHHLNQGDTRRRGRRSEVT